MRWPASARPRVGIVILNEQLIGGDGRDTSAIIVRAVRIQTTEPSLFELPRGTDLILAHAAAGVPDVVASRPVSPGAFSLWPRWHESRLEES